MGCGWCRCGASIRKAATMRLENTNPGHNSGTPPRTTITAARWRQLGKELVELAMELDRAEDDGSQQRKRVGRLVCREAVALGHAEPISDGLRDAAQPSRNAKGEQAARRPAQDQCKAGAEPQRGDE